MPPRVKEEVISSDCPPDSQTPQGKAHGHGIRPWVLSFHTVHIQILPVENPVEIVQTFVRSPWGRKNVTGNIYKFVISCGPDLL